MRHKMKNIVYATLAACGLVACLSIAAPQPAIVPGPSEWTVQTRFEHPRQITLRLPGQAAPAQDRVYE